jgi:ribose/xylose/arabinose/galactoside ABC-type transport system permease subunit/ABC-type branched-subunit amino acid transport system ATPase component
MRSRRSRLEPSVSRIGLAGVAIAMCVFFQVDAGGFINYDNFVTILWNAVPVLICGIAAGRLLITGNVDLAIGGMFGLLSVFCAWVGLHTQSTLLTIVATIGAGALLGAFDGMLVRWLKISPIVVTLGLMSVYAGIANAVTNANAIFGLPNSLVSLGISRLSIGNIPWSLIVALVIFALGGFLLSRTVGGLRSYAIGGNTQASRLAGIRVGRHVHLLYVYMGASVGLVALLITARLQAGSADNGIGFELQVLTAVLLGGVGFAGGSGRPRGIFLGVLTIAILNEGFTFTGINSFYQTMSIGTLLLLALAADQITLQRARRATAKVGAERRADAITSSDRLSLEKRRRETTRTHGDVILECDGISKAYGPVMALDNVSFQLRAGQILCMVGDNGAGKSTVVKILSGVVPPDAGSLTLCGEDLRCASPADARGAGIETVYQELALCPNLGAAPNLVLGREPRKRVARWLSVLDRRLMLDIASTRLRALNIVLDDYYRPVADLSGGQRQSVAITRCVADGINVVILDEPTAALGVRQTASVLELADRLAAQGTGVIMISHDVEDVLAVADQIVVLHLGRVTYYGPASALDAPRLVHLMAGYTTAEQIAQHGELATSVAAE